MSEPFSEHPVECIWCHSEHIVSQPANALGDIYSICRACGIRFWR